MTLRISHRILSVALLTVCILLVTGCGGSGSNDTTVPILLGDVVAFSSTNAMDIADAVLVARNNLSITLAVANVTLPTLCSSGGSFEVSSSGTSTVKDGIVKFDNCNFNNVVIINGSFSFHIRITGAIVRRTGFGELSFTNPADSTSFELVMNFDDKSSPAKGSFGKLVNFAVVDFPQLGSFTAETTIEFVGNFLTDQLSSGELLIYGGNDSLIRITVIATNIASVELDDGSGSGFIEIVRSPIPIKP